MSKEEKARAAQIGAIDRVSGEILHYTAPRNSAEMIYDYLRREERDMGAEDIEDAIDALGLPRAPEDGEE